MSLTDPQDTLAYHQSRVLTSHRDMSNVACPSVASSVVDFMNNDKEKDTSPELEALWFYLMNHGMSLISAKRDPLEPLKAKELDFVREYHTVISKKAIRAFYYLLAICTRESRHNKSLNKDTPKIQKLFGSEIAMFHSAGGYEDGILDRFLKKSPAATIGAYVKSLQWCFYNSTWNGGYGGPAWGKVADCLVRFVTGEYSAEMMMDTIWTLCHNNGPIFNKGMMYKHHSHNLIRLLDIQRAGLVPTAIMHDDVINKFVQNSTVIDIAIELEKMFPGTIQPYVDWFTVSALGAVGNYNTDKKKQLAEHGASEAASQEEKIEAETLLKKKLKEKAEAEKAKMTKLEFDKKHFTIMPGLVVEKIEMKRTKVA